MESHLSRIEKCIFVAHVADKGKYLLSQIGLKMRSAMLCAPTQRRTARAAAAERRARVRMALHDRTWSGQPVRLQPRSASATAASAALRFAVDQSPSERLNAPTF